MFINISFLVILFLLTFGVNGRSEFRTRVTSRQYITRLAANPNDYNVERLRPRFFSQCRVQNGNSLEYYPTAFDTIEGVKLQNFFSFRDVEGRRVNVNASSTLCQKLGNFFPMLVVPKCGENIEQCSFVQFANPVTLRVLPESDRSVKGWEESHTLSVRHSKGKMNRLLVFYRNVQVNQTQEMPEYSKYNRMLCKERPLQGEENMVNPVYFFNCVLGAWNDEGTLFTFQVGELTFMRTPENYNKIIAKQSFDSQFSSSTSEIEVEWDAWRNGEVLFGDALSVLTQDKMSGLSFMDSVISRAVVADTIAGDSAVLEQVSVNVTDIHDVTAVGYILLLATAIVLFALSMLLRRLETGKRVPPVTSFSGLCELLRSQSGTSAGPEANNQKWTFFQAKHSSGQSSGSTDSNVLEVVVQP